MSTLTLPEPIAAYFAADRQSPQAVVRCFAAHATVRDEGELHTGLEAIAAWKAAASARYTYKAEPFAMESRDGSHVVRAHVTGSFPGGMVDLEYRFRLERRLIASLEITA